MIQLAHQIAIKSEYADLALRWEIYEMYAPLMIDEAGTHGVFKSSVGISSVTVVSRQHDIIGHVIDFRNCLRYICANKEVVDEKVHRSIIEGGA